MHLASSVRTCDTGGVEQQHSLDFYWAQIELFSPVDARTDLEGGGVTDSRGGVNLPLGPPVHFFVKCSFRKEFSKSV
jgi:hypothetical protein